MGDPRTSAPPVVGARLDTGPYAPITSLIRSAHSRGSCSTPLRPRLAPLPRGVTGVRVDLGQTVDTTRRRRPHAAPSRIGSRPARRHWSTVAARLLTVAVLLLGRGSPASGPRDPRRHIRADRRTEQHLRLDRRPHAGADPGLVAVANPHHCGPCHRGCRARRLYRGAHFLTDVVGSVLFAVPWLLVTLELLGPHTGSRSGGGRAGVEPATVPHDESVDPT